MGIDAYSEEGRTEVSNTVLLSHTFTFQAPKAHMIDWVTAIIPFVHEPLNSGSVLKVLPSGEVDWESPCRLQVEGSHEQGITVKSQGGDGSGLATELVIHGNPAKFLQGHNIFGSDDLLSLVLDTFLTVASKLNLPLTQETIDLVREGDYPLARVDINGMFELRTLADVKNWLRAAEFKSKTRHGRPSSKGGTLYWGKHSRRWSIKAYSKGEEIQASKSHKLAPQFKDTPLYDFAQNKLRIELTLRSKELEKIGLKTARSWQKETSMRLLNTYIKRIEMSEQIALSTKVLHELPTYLRSTYVLWKDGHNPREMLSKPTFYKHRAHLLQHGIDINITVEKVDRSNVVPLVRVLEAKPVQIPDWAFELGLVHHSAEKLTNVG